MFDTRKADRVVRFIENLKHTKGQFFGQPFVLLPWEKSIIRDVYGTVNRKGLRQYQYIYLEIPKKNGKTELAAAIGLVQLFFDGEINGEVYGCAGDREQATLVFDVAVEMINQVPALKKRTKLNLSTKLITDKKSGTFYQVVSAESYTKHGLNLSACIFDELHVQPNRDLFDVMTKGAGDARLQPLWFIITTAGDDPDRHSIGWEVHEKALGIIKARDEGDKRNDIRTWYPVIYSYQGEDIWKESNWAKANPSLGTTFPIEKLRNAALEARKSKADERLFRWLRLNQWTTTKLSSWLPLDLFDSTSTDAWSRADLVGRECYLGSDLSTTIDLAATCLVFPPQRGRKEAKPGQEPVSWEQPDWRVVWDCWIPGDTMQQRIDQDHVPYDEWAAQGWIQVTEGDVIDYTAIEERILEYKKLYKLVEMGSDPAFAAMLLQRLGQAGLKCVEVPQYYTHLTDPINEIERLLRKHELSHEPHPVARWAFGNASVAKNGNAQVKLVKERKGKRLVETKRIDPMIAWVCAMARAKFYADRPQLSAILDKDWGM